MEQERTKVALYTCVESESCGSDILSGVFEKLEVWALRNERKEYFDFERYADHTPVIGVPYTPTEPDRFALSGLILDIEAGTVKLVVTDDINVLAKSPRALLSFIGACVKHNVQIKVMSSN